MILTLRCPTEAVGSWPMKFPVMNQALMLRIYISFYRAALNRLDSVIFLRYFDVIGNTETLVSFLNKRFDLSYEANESTIDKDEIFRLIDEKKITREGINSDFTVSVARPTTSKIANRKKIISSMLSNHHNLVLEAERIYRTCRDQAVSFDS